MSILILNGSPREGGNTQTLLARVLDGIQAAGGDAEVVRLARMRIAPCTACGLCERAGLCAFDDDMSALAARIAQVRHLVIGSPIYFYGLPAQAKAFVDRCQVFWSRKHILGQESASRGRFGYFVGVAATGGPKCFDGARLTLRYAFGAMNIVFRDEVVVRGVDARGAVRKRPESMQAAFELGRHIGADH